MAVLKKMKRSQGRVTPPSKKKVVVKAKQVIAKPTKAVVKTKQVVAKPTKAVVKTKQVVAKPTKAVVKPKKKKVTLLQTPSPVIVVQAARATLRKDVIPVSSKPTAQTCPLVLDSIVLEEDFSPKDCFSCDEFDCRFYVAEERSGSLGGRLFAAEAGDEEEDNWELLEGEAEEPEGDDDWGVEDDQ